MSSPMHARAVLDREFLEMRAKVLELAASLDRLERAAGDVVDDPRLKLLRQAIEVLSDDRDERAERVQLLFSRPYTAEWQSQFNLTPRQPR
ncbi:MAG: hypothetical protein R3C99_26860 [Pirellulaceae bacterium]|nr:hypothetical protein [Planctomycetales bacterium]MCA9205085.1 hypothetical protein [Planctomycetales bacterium]MCA9222795.1 hypothetical protein [Planctomycetales bacterium]